MRVLHTELTVHNSCGFCFWYGLLCDAAALVAIRDIINKSFTFVGLGCSKFSESATSCCGKHQMKYENMLPCLASNKKRDRKSS